MVHIDIIASTTTSEVSIELFVPRPALGSMMSMPLGRVNTCDFAALPDEIYSLKYHLHPFPSQFISSRIQKFVRSWFYARDISSSQTSCSLRRFFWRIPMAVYRGSRENKNSLTEVKFCERHWHYHCIQKVRKRTPPSLKIVTVGKSQLAQYVKWVVLFESCLLQLTGIHLWKVTVTYPFANIQSRPSFQNRRVVWVYSQTSIRSSTIS